MAPQFGTYTDTRDGRVYKTVLMPDGKWWLSQNLAYSVSGVSYPNNDSNNLATYGFFYSQALALSSVPAGTHLPTMAEFAVAVAGTKSKPFKSATWDNGSNIFGFNAVAAGQNSAYDGIKQFGSASFMWSADAGQFVAFYSDAITGDIERNSCPTGNGFSVRVIVDSGNVPDAPQFGTYTDTRDGHVYKTVLMPDGQWWAAENLAWAGAGVDYNNDSANRAIYGRLYTYSEASTGCPTGTRLAGQSDVIALIAACGGDTTAGRNLKAVSSYWDTNTGTDIYGFRALPGGKALYGFLDLGTHANFWGLDPSGSDTAFAFYLRGDVPDAYTGFRDVNLALSVRFIVIPPATPDAMPVFVGHGGAWKGSTAYIGQGGAWKLSRITVGQGGSWK